MAKIQGTGSSSSGGSDVPWMLSKKPSTAHALDLECDASALPAAWTLSPFGVTTAINPYAAFSTANTFRYSLNSYRPGWLMMQPSNESVYYAAATCSYTFPANCFIWARMSYLAKRGNMGTNNQAGIGIGLHAAASVAANHVRLFLNESDTAGHEVDLQSWSGGVSNGSLALGTTTTGVVPYEYIGIQKIGTTYHGWAAPNGGLWVYIGSQVVATTLDTVALMISDAGTAAPGNAIVGAQFIRFVESATFLP